MSSARKLTPAESMHIYGEIVPERVEEPTINNNVYNYTTPQIMAMWKAYCAAPDDTTVRELRALMDAAAEAAGDQP